MEGLLEELQLISCSILSDEMFVFLEHCEGWKDALQSYGNTGYDESFEKSELPMPSFQIGLEDFNVWFEVTLPSASESNIASLIAVKGENLSRSQQEKWQGSLREKLEDIRGSEYPIYQLISLHILPMLHVEAESAREAVDAIPADFASRSKTNLSLSITYHALFTSHHLVSPTKRRNLQQWSSSLSISGFAKVGHPGVIYAEGTHENIREFVDNVKAMQWLALRLRFMEPVPNEEQSGYNGPRRQWREFQKVGEVTEEMRRVGRERYVVEMGIGSTGASKR